MNISLNTGWSCASSDNFSDALPVPTLANLPGNPDRSTFLRRSFNLKPAEDCVRYVLHLESAPPGMRLAINSQTIALNGEPPYRVDVTNAVALEDNLILIEVPPAASGSIVGLTLEPVPCD